MQQKIKQQQFITLNWSCSTAACVQKGVDWKNYLTTNQHEIVGVCSVWKVKGKQSMTVRLKNNYFFIIEVTITAVFHSKCNKDTINNYFEYVSFNSFQNNTIGINSIWN